MAHTLIAQNAKRTIQVFRRPGGAFVRCTQTLHLRGRRASGEPRGEIESATVHDFSNEEDALAFFHDVDDGEEGV